MTKINQGAFIGRKNELAFLNRAYGSDKAELVVLYGRRRVGKTELLREFCKDKPNIFYLCRKYTDEEQLEEFSKALLARDGERFLSGFPNWDNAFSYLERLRTDEKLVVVMDEFPYACSANRSLPSVLQIAWDTKLKDCNIMLVLCGSSISFIEDELLSEKNPLYGRATGIYKVLPMPYYDAVRFLPGFSDEDKLTALAVLGGVPHYLKQFDSSRTLRENIVDNILSKGAALYSEVDFLLHQELRETAVYNTIVQAIALGGNSFGEILTKTHLEKSKLSVYLNRLIELNIVEKQFPALSGERDRGKSAKGLYELADNFFRFWFTFAYPNLGMLETEDPEAVWEDAVAGRLHSFASRPFEKICVEYMYALNRERRLPFRFLSVGHWWGNVTRKDGDGRPVTTSEEIDVLAADGKRENYILGECKFTNEPFDMGQLKKLRNKTTLNGNVRYFLFSLNGFTDAVSEFAKNREDVFLVTPRDLLSI